MEKVAVSLEVPKELNELLEAILKLVVEGKKALADGMQIADAMAILAACSGDVVKGIDGLNKLGSDYAENKLASDQCLGLFLAKLKNSL